MQVLPKYTSLAAAQMSSWSRGRPQPTHFLQFSFRLSHWFICEKLNPPTKSHRNSSESLNQCVLDPLFPVRKFPGTTWNNLHPSSTKHLNSTKTEATSMPGRKRLVRNEHAATKRESDLASLLRWHQLHKQTTKMTKIPPLLVSPHPWRRCCATYESSYNQYNESTRIENRVVHHVSLTAKELPRVFVFKTILDPRLATRRGSSTATSHVQTAK